MSSIIENKCIEKGVRLTDQRKLIAQVMSKSTDHPDVDELHKRVSEIDSKISITSICAIAPNFSYAVETYTYSGLVKQETNNNE